ncbi:S41 family peptidase [Myxococcota bacterium]
MRCPKGYDRPILVLVNRGCASSCESTLESLVRHPRVVTVGQNTGGYVSFGNNGCILLRHSQIMVQLATDYWRRASKAFEEKVGYRPDVVLPVETDALQYLTTFTPAIPCREVEAGGRGVGAQ